MKRPQRNRKIAKLVMDVQEVEVCFVGYREVGYEFINTIIE